MPKHSSECGALYPRGCRPNCGCWCHKKKTDICANCKHDRSYHPRLPCISGWDGITNTGGCFCNAFVEKGESNGN